MNGTVKVFSAPISDKRAITARLTKADLARIDRVLAGAPIGYLYPKPRLSRPLPADGSPPKGWSFK